MGASTRASRSVRATLAPGSNLLFAGPAGVGKTSTALCCARASIERGGKAAMFLFAEGIKTLLVRLRALGLDIERYTAAGRQMLRTIDPAEISAGQFSHHVCDAVVEERYFR